MSYFDLLTGLFSLQPTYIPFILTVPCFFSCTKFPQLLSYLSRLLTEASQRERSAWHPDKSAAQKATAGAQQRQWVILLLADDSLSFSSLSLFFSPLFSVVSSACCFNSLLITSQVPHKVFISRLSCMGTLHKQQITQECMCAYQSVDPPASCVSILRAHVYLMHVLGGYIWSFTRFPWEKVSPVANINNHTHS